MNGSENPLGRSGDAESLIGVIVADRYRTTSLVSQGANSAIFVAVDDRTGRPATVKLLRPSLTEAPGFDAAFDEAMRGVAAMSHPNIAAVYDWGTAPVDGATTAFVVTELLSGGSVRDLFDRGRRLTPSQALAVGLDACRALDHAHRRGFVHTELTPSKMVFGDDRRLRIVDFGLARLLGGPVWRNPESVANHVAWYAAPELAERRRPDGRCDVYSLCLTLHEAVTGSLPFKSDSTVASLTARVGKLMPVSADLGPLASVLERAGRPDAEDRSTAAEFGQGLVAAAGKLPRPEPLPLLATGLFETPSDRLRSPDDPTGGTTRPGAVVASEPAGDATDGDLVILPLDTDIGTEIDTDTGTGAGSDTDVDVDTGHAIDVGTAARPDAARPAEPGVAASSPAAPDRTVRQRRGVPWKIVSAVSIVVVLAGLGLLATRLLATPVHPVPELTGVPRAEALNLIAPNAWLVEEQAEASDAVPQVDHIVRTVPAVGSELAEGEPFLIVVSTGPVPRVLPESLGATLADAQTALIELDLAVAVVERHDEVVPSGEVVSWTVPSDATLVAGSTVPPETLVELVVSSGPAPRDVPDLRGVSPGEARTSVEAIQLVFVEGEPAFDDVVPAGAVISQDPPAGSVVERGTTVSVTVSRGVDLVQFPDLGQSVTFEAAAEILRDAGFEPVLGFGDAQGEIEQILIDGEDPVVGDSYRRGTVVDITAL